MKNKQHKQILKAKSHDLAINDMNKTVTIDVGDASLSGDLSVPKSAKGLVIFAHGSGSSRHSSRNQYVAQVLNIHHSGTLLIDLLSSEEEKVDQISSEYRFNIEMLADRLTKVAEWVEQQPWATELKIGYFGSSTGGGAALMAAAKRPENIFAVVSRGGRPDLAGNHLKNVQAPTLLIVGELDSQVIKLNEQAQKTLPTHSDLQIISGATHLFEEPGTLEKVAHNAAEFFLKCFT